MPNSANLKNSKAASNVVSRSTIDDSQKWTSDVSLHNNAALESVGIRQWEFNDDFEEHLRLMPDAASYTTKTYGRVGF